MKVSEEKSFYPANKCRSTSTKVEVSYNSWNLLERYRLSPFRGFIIVSSSSRMICREWFVTSHSKRITQFLHTRLNGNFMFFSRLSLLKGSLVNFRECWSHLFTHSPYLIIKCLIYVCYLFVYFSISWGIISFSYG